MKLVNIKFIEIFTDGTVNFSQKKSMGQLNFYEKDLKNSLFFKKTTKKRSFQNLQQNSYKSKYKF